MGQHHRYDSVKIGCFPFLITDGQEKIYVSPNGNDNGDGTYSDPYLTLTRAVSAARAGGNTGKPKDIVMRGGVYHISNTIGLSYNGEWYAPLRISAYGDEEVILNAGLDITLSDMSPAGSVFCDNIINRPPSGAVREYDLSQLGVTDTGSLSVRGHLISDEAQAPMEIALNGEMQKLCGWPNGAHMGLKKSSVTYSARNKTSILNGTSFVVDSDRPSMWSRPDEAWVSGTLGPNYEFDYYPMSRFDAGARRVYLSKGAIVNYYTDPHFRFENIPEELDAPGEYYIDRSTNKLYYYPPENAKGSDKITLTMPAGDVLLRMNQSSNVFFDGITFTGGRGSAVSGTNCKNISFKNCRIYAFGGSGISFGYSEGIEIRNTDIHDVGENGISFSNCGDYANIRSSNITVVNCDIYNFARLEKSYKTGILFGYRSVGALALRNHIHDGPHTGIIFYGVNNDICNNEIDHLVTEFDDMDAVYANNSCYPWERGNRIHMNYFHDLGKSYLNGRHQINVRAVRTDNKGCGLNVSGNLFYNIGDRGPHGNGNNNIGSVTAEGTRNIIVNNLFVDCNETYSNGQAYREITPADDGTLYPNTTVSNGTTVDNTINGVTVATLKRQMQGYLPVYGSVFPELNNFFYEHPNMSKTNVFKNNMIINISVPLSTYNDNQVTSLIPAEGYRANPKLVSASGNYVSTADPGFADYSLKDFRLTFAQTVPEGLPGFKMDSFGLLKE